MLGHRDLSIDDYLAILRRRLWIILIPTILAPIAAYLFSLTLPNEYTSQTLVLVEQQKVPDSFVKSVVTEDLAQRLGTMQEQILSRTRLQPIIERFGLFKQEAGKAPMEDLVERLRKSISITAIRSLAGSRAAADMPGFYISFTASSPRLAQQVCEEITSMFIQENLRAREQRSQGTTEFLSTQLAEAKRKLDDQDAKLAIFKRKYIGALPGQEQTNLGLLTGLSPQLEAVTQSLSRAQQDKAYAESVLAQQLSVLDNVQSTGGLPPDALQMQLATLQNQLVAAQARYTDDHPDVIKLKSSIAEVRREIATASSSQAVKAGSEGGDRRVRETPQIQQLKATIHSLEQTISGKIRDQARIQQQIAMIQSRLSLSPAVEQEFKELTRDYQSALAFYNELLAKESQSQMATNLERRQQGEQFRVMDPPNLPESPSFPNRPMFAGGGLGLGLALGIGITLLIEMRDKSIRSEDDVKFFLQVPTLAVIPVVGGGNGNKVPLWRRLRKKRNEPVVRADA